MMSNDELIRKTDDAISELVHKKVMSSQEKSPAVLFLAKSI